MARRNRIDEAEFRRIADELGLEPSDVKGAVHSFFETIFRDAKSLPFDNFRKIYSKDKFASFSRVRCIPSIGRIGPVYSRYLKWRANESPNIKQVPRSTYRAGLTQDEVEYIADVALSGGTPSFERKKNYDLYQRVWLVGKEGKKLARQVIPKKSKENRQ